MAHDLIIGGSGMLAGLAASLAESGRTISVIARNGRRLEQLATAAPGIKPLPCDYQNTAALHDAIAEATTLYGPIDNAICWIHSSAPDALPIVAPFVNGTFVHIFGSAAGDPSNPALLDGWRQKFEGMPLRYKQAVLGFVKEGAASRWLTHDEICDGVAKAITNDNAVTIVGTVTPWSAHP